MIGELVALGAAICWTVSAILYKEALAETKPLTANTVCCLGTSVFLILCLALLGRIGVLASLSAYVIFLACASGLIGLGLGDTLYMFSLKILGVARAVPITCVYPLFNLVLAALFEGENVTPSVVLAAVTIVLGIWLISQEGETDKAEMQKMQRSLMVRGVVIALVTAVFWSISISMVNLAVKEASSLEHAFAVNTLRIAANAAFLLVFTPTVQRGFKFFKMKRKTAVMLVVGSIIALGLGWFLLALSFSYIPESQAVPISSTTPLFSTLSGIAFLHEKVTAKVAFGSIIIVLGTFLIFMV
ncbi:MAG: EamA family transporter [Candidatus Bathyarchaeia archaeon]